MTNTVTFFEVYDIRVLSDPESATCFESLIDTIDEARLAAIGYGGGAIFKSTCNVDESKVPRVCTEIENELVEVVQSAGPENFFITITP